MKIILFGGAFNPIHQGHLQMAQIALKQLHADRLFFIPSNRGFDKSPYATTSKQRLEMLALSLLDEPKMDILEIEIHEPIDRPCYTIDTVHKVKSKFNKSELYFLIGADQANQLFRWHQIDALCHLVQFLVMPRPDVKIDPTMIDAYNLVLLNGTAHQAASHTLRMYPHPKLLPPLVFHYILNNQLYLNERVQGSITLERYDHTLQVIDAAIQFSPPELIPLAAETALLHDLGKDIPEMHQVFMMLTWHPDKINCFLGVYHQWLSADVARRGFTSNPDVLNAITAHSTMREKMNLLDRIVYAADKTAGRTEPFAKLIPSLASDFKAGFIQLMKLLYEHYHACDDQKSVELYQFYQEEKGWNV